MKDEDLVFVESNPGGYCKIKLTHVPSGLVVSAERRTIEEARHDALERLAEDMQKRLFPLPLTAQELEDLRTYMHDPRCYNCGHACHCSEDSAKRKSCDPDNINQCGCGECDSHELRYPFDMIARLVATVEKGLAREDGTEETKA